MCPPMCWLVTGKTGTRFGLSPSLNYWYGSCTVAVEFAGSCSLNWNNVKGTLLFLTNLGLFQAKLLEWPFLVVRILRKIILFIMYSHINDHPQLILLAKRMCFCLSVKSFSPFLREPWTLLNCLDKEASLASSVASLTFKIKSVLVLVSFFLKQ